MARGSRHKSHRSHKHRDESDSEEEARVSRASEPSKRRSSSGNGDVSSESGKKRKERAEDSAAPDRWNGGGEDDRDGGKDSNEEIDVVDVEKVSKPKPKIDGSDPKGKLSSRSEEKRRSEKETSRRESGNSGQYKDGKEREKDREKERVMDKDRRNEDGGSRKEERVEKKNVVSSEIHDKKHNPEVEKELEKQIKKKRDGSGDNDNVQGDGKESDSRRVSSKDDYSKNGSIKDDRYRDGRHKEKYRDDYDRDQRQRDDKRRDEETSRVHTSDRSDSKYSREDRHSDSRYKTKFQDSDHDGAHVDDYRSEHHHRGRKRSSDEIEDIGNVKPRNTKEPREDTVRNGSRSGKVDSYADRGRDYPHPDKLDSGISNSRLKNSPGSSTSIKDQMRHNSRQTQSSRREPLSEDRHRPRVTSRDDHHAIPGGRERVSESRSSEKTKIKNDSSSVVLLSEAPAASQHDKNMKSDTCSSPSHLSGKSPTSEIDRPSDRIGTRRSLDVDDVGHRSSSYKDERNSPSSKDLARDQELPLDKLKENDGLQADILNSEPALLRPSSCKRTSNSLCASPDHLPPPPPARQGVDSTSVLGPYENENRSHNVDRRANNRYKRNNDLSSGRGPVTPWKSTPTWSPATNGFMPLHGPAAGFHPSQQFPASPIFGIRPSMASYHPHESNRFPGHAHSYGWQNSVDDCPPPLQMWDGSNNMFGDESHMYGRPDWDQNRHLMGSRGWEMGADMWNGQHGNMKLDFPASRKDQEYSTQTSAEETWAGKYEDPSQDDRAVAELSTADAVGIDQPMDASPVPSTLGTPKTSFKNASDPTNALSLQEASERQRNSYLRFCGNYLSKVDILSDLVQPDLYEQYMSLVGTREGTVAGNATNILGHQKDARVVAKSKHYFLNSRSPSPTDIIQRAMSLYNNQKEAVREAKNSGSQFVGSKKENISPAADLAKVDADPPNNVEEDLPTLDSTSATPMDVDKETTVGAGDNEAKLNNPAAGEEKHRENISESVVVAEGSEECEALLPECRVNLSRIHLSLESTH